MLPISLIITEGIRILSGISALPIAWKMEKQGIEIDKNITASPKIDSD